VLVWVGSEPEDTAATEAADADFELLEEYEFVELWRKQHD
jgi:hypothetical protein